MRRRRAAPVPVPAVGTGTGVLLRRLELQVTRRLDGILQGDYQGLLPGPGSEPGEARVYQSGDDIRLMDWNVTARTGEAHVRTPIADRELETWVVADLSASLDFGTAKCEKRDLAVAAVAAVGHLTARVGNRCGALVVHAGGLESIPARPGRDHLMGLLHRVSTIPRTDGGGATELGGALAACARMARRRGLVVVVSDFVGMSGWERPLRLLAGRHDVIAVEVLDPRELELPDVGILSVVDPETGGHLEVQTADRRLRERYAEAAERQRRETAAAVGAAGADHLVLRTDRDWLFDLVAFVDRRRRRRQAAPVAAGRP
ncbi:MAG TPA: DUF58 domain-containing protein [Acidimicrobiales bacterium]|nr:DUF58 domain-containing protein [Acidimicrobiales bacterium]